MACPNATTPIDIDSTKASGKCDLKCELSFHFANSNTCIATHRDHYLSLSYEPVNPENLPVTYNTAGYSVRDIRIYAPSLHTYVGSQTVAEMVIIHSSTTGAKPLLICIPIKEGSDSDGGLLTEIISAVSANAPGEGDQTTVTTQQPYTLNSFIPRKPYFVYSGKEPFQPCSKAVEFVVFAPPDNAVITLQSSSLNTLKSLITAHPVIANNERKVPFFRNETGPGSSADSDEIYIDCQPVNQSESEVQVNGSGSSSSDNITISWDSLKHNDAAKVIFGIIITFLALGILFGILKMVFAIRDNDTSSKLISKTTRAVNSVKSN